MSEREMIEVDKDTLARLTMLSDQLQTQTAEAVGRWVYDTILSEFGVKVRVILSAWEHDNDGAYLVDASSTNYSVESLIGVLEQLIEQSEQENQ